MDREKQIEELFKDLSNAPTGGVNEDFTVGTLKESHTDLFIRTVAGHLVSLNYRKQSDVQEVRHGRWISNDLCWYKLAYYCSECSWVDEYPFNDRHKYCPSCGAKMDGKK